MTKVDISGLEHSWKVSFQIQNRNGLDANPNLKYKSEVERDERVLWLPKRLQPGFLSENTNLPGAPAATCIFPNENTNTNSKSDMIFVTSSISSASVKYFWNVEVLQMIL